MAGLCVHIAVERGWAAVSARTAASMHCSVPSSNPDLDLTSWLSCFQDPRMVSGSRPKGIGTKRPQKKKVSFAVAPMVKEFDKTEV